MNIHTVVELAQTAFNVMVVVYFSVQNRYNKSNNATWVEYIRLAHGLIPCPKCGKFFLVGESVEHLRTAHADEYVPVVVNS